MTKIYEDIGVLNDDISGRYDESPEDMKEIIDLFQEVMENAPQDPEKRINFVKELLTEIVEDIADEKRF